MLPSPPLTDPDVRITRIRFFTRKLRSGDIVLVDDLGWRQRVSREHGPEARPRQIAVTTAPREPFPPCPHELMVIPPDPSAVSRDAVVGAVPPGSPATGGRAGPGTSSAGFACTTRPRKPVRARNGLSPLSGGQRS